jgi:hypothetical protein
MKNKENPPPAPKEGNLLKNAARAVGTVIAKVGSKLGIASNPKNETPAKKTAAKTAGPGKAAHKKSVRKKTGRKR